jgi:hypothetical protein
MATQVQFRRGTTTQNNAFTGAIGEITYDSEAKTLRLHDGSTAGGGSIVTTLAGSQTLTNKTLSSNSVWQGTVIGLAYGGTAANLTAVAGGILYSGGSALAISAAGTSGQVLTSAGSSAPSWTSQSSLTVGTATTSTTTSNINGGSSGNLVYQVDTNDTGFIAPGVSGYVLRSTGASTAPDWVTPTITLGSTGMDLGGTYTTIAGLNVLTASGTSNWKIPVGTTEQRPGTPATGMIRYNSSISSFEGYAASAWASLGGVKSVDGFTYIQAETSAAASNGDLDFYAENAGGDAATQVGQWNRTNLKDYTGTLVGTQTTQNVFNATATTVNAFGAATTLTIGATSGTATIRNSTVAITNAATVGSTLGVTGNLTVNTDKFSVTASSGNTTIAGTLAVTGNTTLTGDLAVNDGDLTTTATTFNLLNTTATTLNIGGAATTMTIGSGSTGATATFQKNVIISGNLTVQGTTTTNSSNTLTVNDSVVYLADNNSGNALDIGLIGEYTSSGLKYTGLVKDASDSVWKFFSAPTNAPTAGTTVDFTGATYDSIKLTAVNKVTITEPASSATLTISNGGSLITSGGHSLTLTTSDTTNVTLPTTGTLASLAGTETFTNKTLTSPTLTFPIIDNIRLGYTTTATAAGTTTLTATSNRYQRFTGSTTQTIVLPVTSTLATGVSYEIENASTGNLTVNSSGGNLVITVIPGVTVQCMCIGTAATTAADWDPEYTEFATITGTGSVALSASPTFTGTLTAATVSATTLTETSDERLKSDIVPLTNALDTILALDGKAFIKNGKASVGLIAQQVQKVLPQVVVTGEDEMQTLSVQYGNIVAVLIEAVKEQQKQIEELKAKLGN